MVESSLIKREQATTFAPCHVSAFFVPNLVPREPERTGSWGAGLCLGAGVVSEVAVAEADAPAITVERTRADGEARVTQAALRQVLGDRPVAVTCRVQEGAPLGQGFGVSGASALSAAFALARCLGEGRSEALKAAHLAEVRSRTGLGDVSASFMGGAVIRSRPGIPPYGTTQRLPMQGDVVVATVDEAIDTSTTLRDKEVMARVTDVGKACMEALMERPSPEAIFRLGATFDQETELVSQTTLDAIEACVEGGVAMAALLGNTVVAYGETEVLQDVLSTWADPFVLPIDQGGLRVIDKMPELEG